MMSPFFELHIFPHFGSIMMAKERLAGIIPLMACTALQVVFSMVSCRKCQDPCGLCPSTGPSMHPFVQLQFSLFLSPF